MAGTWRLCLRGVKVGDADQGEATVAKLLAPGRESDEVPDEGQELLHLVDGRSRLAAGFPGYEHGDPKGQNRALADGFKVLGLGNCGTIVLAGGVLVGIEHERRGLDPGRGRDGVGVQI